MKARPLTSKQRKFVEAYAGNGTEAARVAGYRGDENVLAQVARDNLRKPQIAEAIRKRETKETRGAIATRQERQAFWTSVMHDCDEQMFARLKASELLAKSEADFVERHEVSGKGGTGLAITIDLGEKDGTERA